MNPVSSCWMTRPLGLDKSHVAENLSMLQLIGCTNRQTKCTKKPAPEYPIAGAGVGVLFRIQFVV